MSRIRSVCMYKYKYTFYLCIHYILSIYMNWKRSISFRLNILIFTIPLTLRSIRVLFGLLFTPYLIFIVYTAVYTMYVDTIYVPAQPDASSCYKGGSSKCYVRLFTRFTRYSWRKACMRTEIGCVTFSPCLICSVVLRVRLICMVCSRVLMSFVLAASNVTFSCFQIHRLTRPLHHKEAAIWEMSKL